VDVSPTLLLNYYHKQWYIKRDDLIDWRFSGNKIRKLYTLLAHPIEKPLLSYGGYQSNAMLSIAHLASLKNRPFRYITKPIPERIKAHPTGNLKAALACGMELIEIPHEAYSATIQTLEEQFSDHLIIPQGGADPLAEEGVARLAEEITMWSESKQIEALTIALPSGTGTTALYLSKHLPQWMNVVTVPCVGDHGYLKSQWRMLESHEVYDPLILENPYRFGNPNPTLLHHWQGLRDAGCEFDLLYAPVLWSALCEMIECLKEEPVMVIHTGGVMGNETMWERYCYKGYAKGAYVPLMP